MKSYGHFVFWRELAEDDCASHEVVKAKAEEEGVGWVTPVPPEPRTVIGRVIQALSSNARERRFELSKVKAGAREVEYTVLLPDEAGKKFAPCGGIYWTEKDGLSFTGLEPEDRIRIEAEELYSTGLGSLSKDDWLIKMREALTVRWAGLPARANGVVYWLPCEPEVQSEMNAVNTILLACSPVEIVVTPCLSAGLACEIVRVGYTTLLEKAQRGGMSEDRRALLLDAELPKLARGQAVVAALTADEGIDEKAVAEITATLTKLQELRTMLPSEPVPQKRGRQPKKERAAKPAAPAPTLTNVATGEEAPIQAQPAEKKGKAPPAPPAPAGPPVVKKEVTLHGNGAPPTIEAPPQSEGLPLPAAAPPPAAASPTPVETPQAAPPVDALPSTPPAKPESLVLMAPDGQAVEVTPPGRQVGEMFEYAISDTEFSWAWCTEPTRGVDWCAFGGAVYTTGPLF